MNFLVFGGTGSIGSYIVNELKKLGNNVYIITSKKEKEDLTNNIYFLDINTLSTLDIFVNLNGVIWAHGININDNIENVNNLSGLLETNVTFIVKTLEYMLNKNIIKNGSNLVIISSIWEKLSRDNKLSYSISKSALSGLVKSASYELSSKNILINNVCPGPIDNEMTQNTLKQEQLEYLKNYMNFGRLVSLDDVWRVVKFLLLENTGVTGQSIMVDLGFCVIKKYK
jgi:NAD(P)-dependent dehydrogenase (short-subunit alcohol dehydrogenase family)